MDKNKILITTNLKDTWGSAREAVFTGEWCINYKDDIPYKKYYIEKDIFRSRDKLYDDYLYLDNFYQKYIISFSEALNKYHNTNYSNKFWKIYLGIWLRNFLELSYAHYKIIKNLIELKKPDYSIIRKFETNHFFIKNYKVYIQCMPTDSWRHYLQSEILANLKNKINIENIYPEDDKIYFEYSKNKIKKNIINEGFKKIYSKLFHKKITNSEYLIKKTYLSTKDENILNFKLNSFPPFVDSSLDFKCKKFSRENFKVFHKSNNEFEEIINKIILKFIPSTYLENFEELNSILSKIPMPAKPRVIFSVHLLNDEILSLYSALKIEKYKTKFVYGQHGGVYGQYKFSTQEDHELELSEKYITWGWEKYKKNIAFGFIKENYNYKNFNQNQILIILRQNKIFYQRLNSGVWVSHYDYMDFLINFFNKIKEKDFLKDVLVRLHARRYAQFDEREILNDQIKNLKIDDGSTSIKKLINKSNLVINTYISSGYLELAANNIPNILFTQSYKDILSDESIKIFDELKINNMYFDDAEELREFLSKNHLSIQKWWFSDNIQNCRKKLCNNFAKIKANKINSLTKIIYDVGNN